MDQSHKKLVHHMVLMQTVFSAPLMYIHSGVIFCLKRHLVLVGILIDESYL